MYHPLFVAPLEIWNRTAGQLRFQQRLADPGDVAVPEDAEAALDQPVPYAVALGPLRGEETDDRLADGEPHGTSPLPGRAAREPGYAIGSRGSTGWSGQVPRIHAWAGSSLISQARSPGPAMTLR